MSFDKTFCPSPWFHARITNTGNFEYCRWMSREDHPDPLDNIKEVSPVVWFQKNMAPLRQTLLEGGSPPACQPCHDMEKHGKVSGRQKQLLKTGVLAQNFVKTMQSSPWLQEWRHSQRCQGHTMSMIQDWQIDLGNYCNSACLFCSPESSSRLASEFKQLKLLTTSPKVSWCDDPDLLDRFVETLRSTPEIRYMHFIGGETLITPAFKKILKILIKLSLNETVTIGFTTNLTVIDNEIVSLLSRFCSVHLGMSIECLDRVNDYVRYGGQISETLDIMTKWLDIAKDNRWLIQIRTTPTVLTVSRLTEIYEYAWNNKTTVESCNFLHQPVFMKPSVLPIDYRKKAKDSLSAWINSKSIQTSTDQIINIRHPDFVRDQLLQDAMSYIDYLDNEPDESHLLPDLVAYLKIMDKHRGNCVLDYLPEYEELFRSAGY